MESDPNIKSLSKREKEIINGFDQPEYKLLEV